jgi:hypothetical protein
MKAGDNLTAPARKINPLMRLMISALLVAFAIFVVQYRKSVAPSQPGTPAVSTKPFPALPPEGENRFAWVPSYPGAEMENINTKQARDQVSYGFSFRTKDDFSQVLSFYRDRLQTAGFKVDVKTPGASGGELHAEGDTGKRSVDVIAAKRNEGGAEIGVTAVQR